jgi:hypothetical protein
MDRYLLTTKFKNKFLFIIFFGFINLSHANPLRPEQQVKDKKNDPKNIQELVKWPRTNLYHLGLQFSNSRIDGFQIANNTKGTLVSEMNMAVSLQYFNWRKPDYDISLGLKLESIKMLSEFNLIPIDNSQVMAIGLNMTGRYLIDENLYLNLRMGLQDKLFYAPNAGLTGYEISKPMIPYLGGGFSALFAEFKKIKIGFEAIVYLYQSSSASNYQIDSGQGYEIALISIWPRGSNQIITEFFYAGGTQNTSLIRTEEQKIGFGVKYLF